MARTAKPLKDKSISQLKKLADDVFSLYIRKRDGRCFTCGSYENLQCGHYIPRDCLELRYAEKNCNAQCVGCNVFKKGNYTAYSLALMRKYGDNILYDLDEIVKKYRADGLKKYPKSWYVEIIDRYRILLKE
jgi:5-methylcytosine-specific restriction endonuclease McrA